MTNKTIPLQLTARSLQSDGLRTKPQLVAVIKNVSPVEQKVITSDWNQPIRLILTDSSGKEVPSEDLRAIESRLINYANPSETLSPGQEIFRARLEYTRLNDHYEASWGTYRFRNILPGTYQANLIWESAMNSYTDQTGKKVPIENIWLGKLESEPVQVVFPGETSVSEAKQNLLNFKTVSTNDLEKAVAVLNNSEGPAYGEYDRIGADKASSGFIQTYTYAGAGLYIEKKDGVIVKVDDRSHNSDRLAFFAKIKSRLTPQVWQSRIPLKIEDYSDFQISSWAELPETGFTELIFSPRLASASLLAQNHPQYDRILALAKKSYASKTPVRVALFGEFVVDIIEKEAMQANIKTLTYKDITFTAPNTLASPYQVIAQKGGKVFWQINNSVRLADMSEQEKQDLKNGGIDTLLIQNVQESILDKNADNFQELKKYIGKPALYIYNILIAGEKSVDVRDINTGERIGFVVHN